MGFLTWIVIGVIVLAIIGLGAGVFFSGVIEGAAKVAQQPAIKNATEQAKEFVGDKIDEAASSITIGNVSSGGGIKEQVLVVTTNKFTYQIGQGVILSAKNNGDKKLAFPNSALGLEITNTDTGKMYPIFAAQVITELEPSQTKPVTWQPEDENGKPVEPGNCQARIRTTPDDFVITANVSFKII